MNKNFVRADSFFVKKYNLRVYRIAEPGSAAVLWTSEIQAARYVQKLHIQKLLVERKRR